ncbi:hypothetical protein ACQKFS_02350 [Pseudomonas guineae]|uniref:hypothetical protein n=1 Tax=Pseudomonas guineae TaxID=425504 RepID=UPI003D020324
MNLNSKWIHIITFLACFIGAGVLILLFPELKKDQPTTLGTAGVFLTLYGVTFAIIELVRLKSASFLANKEARRVFDIATNLVTAREIIECQTKIEIAVEAIDEKRLIPSASLCSIVKLYSQVFHHEVGDDNSEHRKHRSIVQAYYISGQLPPKSSGNTKKALLGIAGHLAQLQGSTNNFAEHIK